MRATHATITVSKDRGRLLSLEGRFPVAGPHPAVSGMKKLYWGMAAYCIKCGAYVYKVDQETYKRA